MFTTIQLTLTQEELVKTLWCVLALTVAGCGGGGGGPVAYELVHLMGSSLSTDVLALAGSTVQGSILLQVLPNRKLRVETFPGAFAAFVGGFTAAAKTYER